MGQKVAVSLFLPHGSGGRQENLTPLFYPLYPSNHVPSFTQRQPSLQILANLSWFGWNSGQNGVGQVDEESVLVAVWICTALQSESPSPRVDEARE